MTQEQINLLEEYIDKKIDKIDKDLLFFSISEAIDMLSASWDYTEENPDKVLPMDYRTLWEIFEKIESSRDIIEGSYKVAQ